MPRGSQVEKIWGLAGERGVKGRGGGRKKEEHKDKNVGSKEKKMKVWAKGGGKTLKRKPFQGQLRISITREGRPALKGRRTGPSLS